MHIKFLGTGTSTGVPEIGCRCEVCTSKDSRDNRLRTSALIETENKRILIDCGPDFRQQMLKEEFKAIDALLITHEHYDHVGGIDDLRPFCSFGDVDIYAEANVCNALKTRIPYCFSTNKYPGVPQLELHEIKNEVFYVDNVKIEPIRLIHYKLPILGYRLGNFAYLTDMKTIPDEEYVKLKDLDVLVIDALRMEEHMSHQNLKQALENIERIAPKKAYLIHLSHGMGLHAKVEKTLPENVFISYDGLELDI